MLQAAYYTHCRGTAVLLQYKRLLLIVVYVCLPTGGQLLLLAWGGGGGCGVWEAEGEAEADHNPWRHSGEEDGSGGGHLTAWTGQASELLVSHSDAANELARAGAAPSYSHPVTH